MVIIFFVYNFTKITAIVNYWNFRELSAMFIFDVSDQFLSQSYYYGDSKWFPKWTGNSAPSGC